MFSINYYSGLLLLGCFQALVFSVILLFRWRRDERIHDLFAALILIVGGLYAAQWMFGFAGWYDQRDWRTTVMFYLEWNHLAALGPLIWLYFLSLTNTDFRWEKRYWMHFIPAFLFLLLPVAMFFYDVAVYAWIGGNSFTDFDGSRGPFMEYKHEHLNWAATIEDVFVRVQLLVYLVMTLRAFRGYRDYVSSQFANGKEYYLPGLRILLYIFLIGIGLAYLSELYAVVSGIEDYADVWPRYFAISLLTYAASIQFYRFDARQTRQLRFDPKQQTKEESQVDLTRWVSKLEKRLDEHNDFLEPDIKLADLAQRIGSNASVLSKVINLHYGLNFNDLINTRRCEKFISRIQHGEHRQHTLLSLALDSGFNSKSTFNRAFRKLYGYSPGEAVDRLGSNDDLGRPIT